MEWTGANPHPKLLQAQKSDGYYTYLKREAGGFKTLTANGYKSVTYENLYPGIDVVYTFPEKGGMEYNLVVHPGADAGEVKFKYSGNIKSLEKDGNGNIIVTTPCGQLTEHAPVSFTGKRQIKSSFYLLDSVAGFSFPKGYNHNMPLVVDPWITAITSMPPVNLGFNVDYDAAGNLFVYGAGPVSIQDYTDFFSVAKYSATGSFQWVFRGSVPSVNWSSLGDIPDASGFMVDKVTGKMYMANAFDLNTGASCIRINAAGAYDNFVSAAHPDYNEIWGIVYNRATNAPVTLGGGTSSWRNLATLDPVTGFSAPSNITGITGNNLSYQDIAGGVYDSHGNLYTVLTSSMTQLPYPNTIYKVNSTFNGYLWQSNAVYTGLAEAENVPFWVQPAGGNWANCLAVNNSYLYSYSGNYLTAYNLNDGSIAGYYHVALDNLIEDGIAVDACNNVYVGGIGAVKTFTFNGSGFSPGADIALGSGFQNDTVHDVKLNTSLNLLYVTGSRFVGTLKATLSKGVYGLNPSIICSGDSTELQLYGFTSAVVTPTTGVTWQNSTTAWLKPGATTTYTVSGQPACANTNVTVTIAVPAKLNYVLSDTVICQHTNALLTLTGQAGVTIFPLTGVNWQDSLHALLNPDSTTTYIIKGISTTCGGADSANFTMHVNQPAPVTVSISDTVICLGNVVNVAVTGLHNVSVSAYNNYYFFDSTHVQFDPQTAGNFPNVIYGITSCGGAFADSFNITAINHGVLPYQLNKQEICQGDSAFLSFVQVSGISIVPDNSVTWLDSTHAYLHPDTNTVYQVYGQTVCTGQSSTSISIRVFQPGVVNYAFSSPFGTCSNLPDTLKLYGMLTLSITPYQAIHAIDSIHYYAVLNPGTSTTYTVTGTSVCGGHDSTTISLPVVPISSTKQNKYDICYGDSAIITVYGLRNITITPANSIAWIDSSFDSSHIYVFPDTVATYSISGLRCDGYSNFFQNTITVIKPGIVDYYVPSPVNCPGVYAYLAIYGLTNVQISPSSLLYYFDATDVYTDLYPTATTTYHISGNSVCGGYDSANVLIQVVPPAGFSFSKRLPT